MLHLLLRIVHAAVGQDEVQGEVGCVVGFRLASYMAQESVTFGRGGVAQGGEEWQCYLLLLDIVEGWFAEGGFWGVVEHIVAYLEGEAEVVAVVGEGVYGLAVALCACGAGTCACLNQCGGLLADDLVVGVLGYVETSGMLHLAKLAFAQVAHGFADDREDLVVATLEGEAHAPAKEEVANEDSHFAAP